MPALLLELFPEMSQFKPPGDNPDFVPNFVRLRGCINCAASKRFKEKHGVDYGFDHELQVICLLYDCFTYGHTLVNPFFDLQELMEEAKKEGNPKHLELAKTYCLRVKQVFGNFYEKIGVSLDDFLKP